MQIDNTTLKFKNLDYSRSNGVIKKFVNPPKNYDLIGFDENEVKTIARQKLGELRARQTEIDKVYQDRTKEHISGATKKDAFSELMLTVVVYEHEQESSYLAKWVRYWKRMGGFTKPPEKTLSQETIEQARAYPLEDLIPGTPRRSGGRITLPCPFHNVAGQRERSHSFFIYNDNSYHCFSCSAHGANAIDYVMQTKNLKFEDAVKELYGR